MKPYLKIAVAYAKAAEADTKRKKFGKWIRLAATRFLNDLKRAEDTKCHFLFDEWHANDACDFIEKLPHIEGKWDTENIVLHPAQVFSLFSCSDSESAKTTRGGLLLETQGVLHLPYTQRRGSPANQHSAPESSYTACAVKMKPGHR